MKNDLARGGWLVIVIIIALTCLFTWCSSRTSAPQVDERPVFQTVSARQDYYRLLNKHGLAHDVAVVFQDPLGKYFIRNGKRCPFK